MTVHEHYSGRTESCSDCGPDSMLDAWEDYHPDERVEQGDRRTLTRRRADSFRADVLRGERSPLMGEVESEDRCESARRMNFGEEDWWSLRCDLSFGHSGNHIHDDYDWENDDD